MTVILRHLLLAALLALSASLPGSARAEEAKVPYWASIRPDEVNMRAGPGEEYKISWVYHRQHLPLKVLRIKEAWRFVRDPDGAEGWIHSRFLTRQRGAYVMGRTPADMRESGDGGGKLLWRLAPGVVALLGDCTGGWCVVNVAERKGYVEQARLWGAGEP